MTRPVLRRVVRAGVVEGVFAAWMVVVTTCGRIRSLWACREGGGCVGFRHEDDLSGVGGRSLPFWGAFYPVTRPSCNTPKTRPVVQ